MTLIDFFAFVAAVLFLSWFAYRLGYEAGRECELTREGQRLDAEAKRLANERATRTT